MLRKMLCLLESRMLHSSPRLMATRLKPTSPSLLTLETPNRPTLDTMQFLPIGILDPTVISSLSVDGTPAKTPFPSHSPTTLPTSITFKHMLAGVQISIGQVSQLDKTSTRSLF